MAYTPLTIKELINLGANLKISGTYTPATLKEFVSLAKEKKVRISIKVNSLTPLTLKELVDIGQEYLTLEI
jgi:hypothetical protein